jgi:hypothetical protein
MNKVILLITHLGSESRKLCNILDKSKRIQWIRDTLEYDHPRFILSLSATEHKYSNSIGLFINEILFNYQISHKSIYNVCDFIYLARSPKETFSQINSDLSFFSNYYIFRLRRMYEMARETKNAMFLRWEDVENGKALKILEEKLHLPEKLEFDNESHIKKQLSVKLLREAENAFELYTYRINKLALNRH